MSLLLQLQALLQVDVSRATSTTLLQYAALLQVEGSPTLTTALCPNAAATSGVAAQLQQFCCSPNVVERRPCCNCNNTYVVMTSTMGAMLQPQQRPCCGGECNGGHAATATVPMLPRCCVGRIEWLVFYCFFKSKRTAVDLQSILVYVCHYSKKSTVYVCHD